MNPNLLPSKPPNITGVTDHVINHRTGYTAKAFCQIDGLAGMVEITVNSRSPEYSTFSISVYDPETLEWKHVNSLDTDEVGHMGVIGDKPENLHVLNGIAHTLWLNANAIVTQSRSRADELSIQLAVAKDAALFQARDERSTAARAWVHEAITKDDFVLSGSAEHTRLIEEYEAQVRDFERDHPEDAPGRIGDEDHENAEPYTGAMDEEQG